MEKDFKNRMYDYEVAPPAAVWLGIDAELNKSAKVIKLHHGHKKKRSTSFFYSLAAASVILFIIVNIFFLIQQPSKSNQILASNNDNQKNVNSGYSENKTTSSSKPYVTIANGEGKSVKVSKKVAAIIASPDKSPTKVVFNKKVEKWKNIMLTSSGSSIFDIMDITKSEPAN